MNYEVDIEESVNGVTRRVRVSGEEPAGTFSLVQNVRVYDVAAALPVKAETISRAEHIEAFEAGQKHERKRIAEDLQACRDAAERLKSELDAAKTAADVAIARAEAAEAKLLTSDRAVRLYDLAGIHADSASERVALQAAIKRATRPA